MCDHKWGDGKDEYSKARTLYDGVDEYERVVLLRCDMCKTFILEVGEVKVYEVRQNGSVVKQT